MIGEVREREREPEKEKGKHKTHTWRSRESKQEGKTLFKLIGAKSITR